MEYSKATELYRMDQWYVTSGPPALTMRTAGVVQRDVIKDR
jgi:hypothetical protein